MTFPVLETRRLELVEVDQQYVKSLFDIMSIEDVMKYYGMDPLETEDQATKIIESFKQNYENSRGTRWGMILKETNMFVGTIGLNQLNLLGKKAEVGFELHPSYWRRGITSEALKEVLRYSFEYLDLFRVGAITFPENDASGNLLKSLGFKEEGRLRGYLFQNQRSHDALVYSILKTEWR